MHVPPSSLLMYVPLLALLGVAAVTDFRRRRIPNWLTSTVALAGIAQSLSPLALTSVFQSLAGIPIRMVSYGGSRHNISILIPRKHKEQTLQLLNKGLFGLE